MVIPAAAYTRPADITAYADGDALSDSTTAPTVLTFANCARENGGYGHVHDLTLIVSAGAAGPTTGFKLVLFSVAPTPTNDNDGLDVSAADALNCVGSYALTSSSSVGATSSRIYHNNNIEHDVLFKCAAGSKDLYGLVQVNGTYTPPNAGVFTFSLGVVQN
jgi:hypothetical protein